MEQTHPFLKLSKVDCSISQAVVVLPIMKWHDISSFLLTFTPLYNYKTRIIVTIIFTPKNMNLRKEFASRCFISSFLTKISSDFTELRICLFRRRHFIYFELTLLVVSIFMKKFNKMEAMNMSVLNICFFSRMSLLHVILQQSNILRRSDLS